jgi:glycosyltransferase involved in cell wall biosynthesis
VNNSEEIENIKIIKNQYNELLQREPDNLGLAHYLKLLSNKKINEQQLSELIKSSPEFLQNNPTSIPRVIFSEKLENTPDPKIVAMYRIKNEERWIEKSLEAASEICQQIVVLDDGSTDNTLKICKSFSSVVDIHEQKNLPFDDTRDKNILLKMSLKCNPDFIMTLDGDEVIMPNMKQILKEDLTILYPQADVYHIKFLEVREKPNQIRINDLTATDFFPVILRLINQPKNLCYQDMKFPGNVHCPDIPQNAIGQENTATSRFKVLHYGLYDEKLRLKKYQHYTKLDPENTEFFGYKHLIDPEKFCGPLQFSYLPKGAYVEEIE